MTEAGLNFEVITKPVDECAIKQAMLAEGAKPCDIADALAQAKAMRVSRIEDGFVIGADQIMVMEGRIFDKPSNIEAARARLKQMRGKTHNLIGAVVICENGAPVWRDMSKTTLTMRDFSDEFLENYLKQEGVLVTKSVGGYRFEGRGAQLFSRVEGDFFSILGLPLLPLLDYLRQRGIIAS
jgi:septum formation protein